MMLTCPDEAYNYVGAAIFDALMAMGVGSPLEGRPLQLQVGLVDPDCVLYIDVDRRELRFGNNSDHGGTALIAMEGDAAVRYCQGRLDIAAAVAGGEVIADGDWREFVDMLSDRTHVAASFETVVRSRGRADLLPEPVAC